MENREYRGLKEAVEEMPSRDDHNGIYVEVHYDMDEDEVYTHYHCCFGYNNWTKYHDPAVIRVGYYSKRVSEEQLKTDIEEAIAYAKE